jgi:hypothetical protein
VAVLESPVRKDQRAREIATRDGITEGLWWYGVSRIEGLGTVWE